MAHLEARFSSKEPPSRCVLLFPGGASPARLGAGHSPALPPLRPAWAVAALPLVRPYGYGPPPAQSRTKKALLFNSRGLNKTAFVVRFWAGLVSLRPAAGPPPFGLRSPCAPLGPCPASGLVPAASPGGSVLPYGAEWRFLRRRSSSTSAIA